MKKILFTMMLAFAMSASAAGITPLETKSISETTLIYTSPANLTALGYAQDGTGKQGYSAVSSRGIAVDPTDETSNQYNIGSVGTYLKSASSKKEVLMYVTNVKQVDAYTKNNSADGRAVVIKATPSSGEPLTVTGTNSDKGYSGRVSLELDPNESYTISFTSPNGDITLYAVRLIAPINTGIHVMPTTGNHASGAAYNLSGQRVDEQYKGIVIVNGKKVVMK